MFENLQYYFTFEMIYLWINYGILPFWLILIFFPNSKLNQILVNSVIIPSILASTYAYIVYQSFILDISLLSFFTLFLGLDNLYALFGDESFLLIFWIHFLTLNLFLGSWASRDGVKYSIPKWFMITPLLLIYFTGPVGLFIYWFLRIFFAKKLGFHD